MVWDYIRGCLNLKEFIKKEKKTKSLPKLRFELIYLLIVLSNKYLTVLIINLVWRANSCENTQSQMAFQRFSLS